MVALWLNPGPPPLYRERRLPPNLACVVVHVGTGAHVIRVRLKRAVARESAKIPPPPPSSSRRAAAVTLRPRRLHPSVVYIRRAAVLPRSSRACPSAACASMRVAVRLRRPPRRHRPRLHLHG